MVVEIEPRQISRQDAPTVRGLCKAQEQWTISKRKEKCPPFFFDDSTVVFSSLIFKQQNVYTTR